MKRTLLGLVLLLLAVSSPAAIQYDYTQKSVTEDAVVPTTDLTARAIIDGAKSRVDFLGGNLYPPGTFVITTDGSRLYFVDPTKKWYTEFNAAGAVSAIGAAKIKIENLRTDIKELADRPMIAGVETTHYQLTIDYDVTVTMRAIPLKQTVHTVIDTWTTTRFGDLTQHVLASGVRTGNVEIDRLMDVETTKVHGFPMKQTVMVTTTFQNRKAQSKLPVSPSRTVMREMKVTAIRETNAKPTDFLIPSGYTRANTPELPRTATEVLTFEPTSK